MRIITTAKHGVVAVKTISALAPALFDPEQNRSYVSIGESGTGSKVVLDIPVDKVDVFWFVYLSRATLIRGVKRRAEGHITYTSDRPSTDPRQIPSSRSRQFRVDKNIDLYDLDSVAGWDLYSLHFPDWICAIQIPHNIS